MAQTLRATAWAGWAEWEEAYSWLFAIDDAAARRRGVARVAAWRARARLPLAVDATASLVEVGLLEVDEAERGPDGSSERAIALSYAMALTRLVNGIVDPLQQRARASSVARLAAEVGLPASLVEIRHESTHNRLPSVPILRIAADQAMLWLHERYWLSQRAALAERPRQVASCLLRLGGTASKPAAGAAAEAGGVPARRVAACARALCAGLVQPHELGSAILLPMLDSADALPAEVLAEIGGAGGVGAGGEREARVHGVMRRGHWHRLLRRLQRRWPHEYVGGELLLQCAHRLAADGLSGDRAEAAATWASLVLAQRGGGTRAPLRLHASQLVRFVKALSAMPVRAAGKSAEDEASLLAAAARREDCPESAVAAARSLIELRAAAAELRARGLARHAALLGGTDTSAPAGPDRVGTLRAAMLALGAPEASLAEVRDAQGGSQGRAAMVEAPAFKRCKTWSPLPIGASL